MPQVRVLSPRPKFAVTEGLLLFLLRAKQALALGILTEVLAVRDKARWEWRSGQSFGAAPRRNKTLGTARGGEAEDAAGSRSRLPPRSVLLCFAQRCPPDTRTLSPRPEFCSNPRVAAFFIASKASACFGHWVRPPPVADKERNTGFPKSTIDFLGRGGATEWMSFRLMTKTSDMQFVTTRRRGQSARDLTCKYSFFLYKAYNLLWHFKFYTFKDVEWDFFIKALKLR